jgi:cytochrome c oxidase assembly protein subunit 15
MISVDQASNDRQVALWLIFCSAVVLGMILLGGVTRLTHSGLSMVEWKPLIGIIPPLTEQAWMTVFHKYQQFPEYQQVNLGMDLSEFKSIFMFEYLHRVLGRLIGVFFFFPFLFFAFKGRIKKGLMPKLVLMFFLGGLQGLLGWYMVKSGLVNDPHVSQYRLTAHLGAAVLIYGYMLWVAFGLLLRGSEVKRPEAGRYAGVSVALVGLIYLMILSGGLVAGTRAGFAYNTWPLMGGSFIPDGLYAAPLAMFENITTVQFNHRMFAYLLFFLVSTFSWLVYRGEVSRRSTLGVAALMLALLVQIALGISTLLFHVHVVVAVAHQGVAMVVFTAMLYTSHSLVSESRG